MLPCLTDSGCTSSLTPTLLPRLLLPLKISQCFPGSFLLCPYCSLPAFLKDLKGWQLLLSRQLLWLLYLSANLRLLIFFFKALVTTWNLLTLLFDYLQMKEIFSKAGILFWPCSIQTHRVQGWHTAGISSVLFPFQNQSEICFHSLSKNNNKKKGDL